MYFMCFSTKLSPFASEVEYIVRVLYFSLCVIFMSSFRISTPCSDSENDLTRVLIVPTSLC